jgi:UDPglucose 6-dehydrogenase
VGVADEPFELAVIGAGYVGLVTAASLAMLGCVIRCIDRNATRIAGLHRGVMPFFEPGLEDAVAQATAAGRLTFATEATASHGTKAAFVCVGTLDERGDWTARDVRTALIELAADPEAPRTLIVRSTLMPGTTTGLAQLAAGIDPEIEIATNPEFTRQGSAMNDFGHTDRLVFGLTRPVADSQALPILQRAYAGIDAPAVVTDSATSELIKVGSNAFLALKAGFANEIARVSAATGADARAVVDGIGLDPRIERAFLTPGPGFGGSCLPSQSRALPATARELGVVAPILSAADESNVAQAQWVADRLERAVGALPGLRIAILGLTFKAGTSDVRESAALSICRALAAKGAMLTTHDPAATVDEFEAAESALVAAQGADAIVIATEWPEYGRLEGTTIANAMRGDTVFDTRSVVDAPSVRAAGLKLLTI